MPSFSERLESELNPVWGAMAAALGALYATWPVLAMHDAFVGKSQASGGWIVLIIFGFIAFSATFAIATTVLAVVFCRLKSHEACSGITLALIAIYLVVHRLPHPAWLVVIGAAGISAYFQGRKAHADARDREKFFDE